jgi:hypothetical protein
MSIAHRMAHKSQRLGLNNSGAPWDEYVWTLEVPVTLPRFVPRKHWVHDGGMGTTEGRFFGRLV